MNNKAEDISPSMCIMPWIGLATDPSGGIRPCCWMNSKPEDKFWGNPADYKDSEYLKNIKDLFLNGEYHKACNRCSYHDKQGLNSKRNRENANWIRKGGSWDLDIIENKPFSVIDLRLSNVCNLGCMMCNPKNSSFIQGEFIKYNQTAPDHFGRVYKNVTDRNTNTLKPYSDDQIDEIIDIIGPTARVYCTGGEPSMVKKTTKLLEVLIEKGYNKTLHLEFNSNFSKFNQSWFDLLKQFKGDMMPSLDGVGSIAEYIRYPCDWNLVEVNIKEFINQCGESWSVKCMPTVSALNIFYLKDMFKWWYEDMLNNHKIIEDRVKEKKIPMKVQCNNILFSPAYFSLKNLPKTAKLQVVDDIDYIIKKYKNFFYSPLEEKWMNDIKTFTLANPEVDQKHLITQLDKFDKMRNNNWKKSLPRLAQYLL